VGKDIQSRARVDRHTWRALTGGSYWKIWL